MTFKLKYVEKFRESYATEWNTQKVFSLKIIFEFNNQQMPLIEFSNSI